MSVKNTFKREQFFVCLVARSLKKPPVKMSKFIYSTIEPTYILLLGM